MFMAQRLTDSLGWLMTHAFRTAQVSILFVFALVVDLQTHTKGNAWFPCEMLNRCRTELAVSCDWEEFFKEKAHWHFMARFLHLGRDSENKVVSIRSYILRTVQFSWYYYGLCIQFLETSCIIYLLSCCGFTTLHLKGAGPLQDELLVL